MLALYFLLLPLFGLANETECEGNNDACPNQGGKNYVYGGGAGGASVASCPIYYTADYYMYQGSKGQGYTRTFSSIIPDKVYVGGGGQGQYTTCVVSQKVYSYMYEGSKGQSYSRLCSNPISDIIYLGGKGQADYSNCLISDPGYSYMYEGSKGQSYTRLCSDFLVDYVYQGGRGQSHYTNCPSLPWTVNLYRGGAGQTSTESCYLPFIDRIYFGGKGQTAFTTCPDVAFNIISLGGKGKSSTYSCYLPFIDRIYFGGQGQTAFTTCPDVAFDIISHGGKGNSFFESCYLPFVDRIYFGGTGQTAFTTCPDVAFDIISHGGVGQTAYNSCRDDFFDRVTKGGVGQTAFNTCLDDSFNLTSRGGIGQTAYNTCRDDFFDRIYYGGIGQSFFTSCADVLSLFIRKAVSEAISCTGRTNIFTISIENMDYAVHNLTNISVRDSLGFGLAYKGYSATTGAYDPLTGIWTVPLIEKGKTHTLTLKASSDQSGTLTNYAWIKGASVPGAVVKDTVSASVLTKAGGTPRSDIRAQVVVKPNREINLSSYLDTLFQSTVWKIGSAPAIDVADQTKFEDKGIVKTDKFEVGKTYSYYVKVIDECLTDNVMAYIKVLAKDPLYPNDRTVRICFEDQKTVNLSAIIGIDAGKVEWVFNPNEAQYLTMSSKNAAIYNAEKAWNDPNIAGTDLGGGRIDKTILISYKVIEPGSVLENKVYTLRLVITNKLIP